MPGNHVNFGVNLSNRIPIIKKSRNINELLALAKKTEESGYDSVWVGDGFVSKPRLESISTLAAAAAITSKVKLGTATMVGPLRNPIWLAITWGSLDVISAGRTILTMGVGGGRTLTVDQYSRRITCSLTSPIMREPPSSKKLYKS